MTQVPKAEYPCTAQELYSIAETIYANALANLGPLTAYKAKYTAAYINGLKANVATAKNIPDEEMRNSAFQNLRSELIPLNEKCTSNFQLLKGYINDAYPKTQLDARYDAAGQTFYTDASHENWEMTVGMNTAMKNFIAAELAALTANNNMPAAFQTTVTTDSSAFDFKYNAFKLARQTTDETTIKINANNKVFAELTSLNDDAQRVYAKNIAIKKMFVFETVKAIVSPPGSANLTVTVLNKENNSLVPDSEVTLQAPKGKPFTAKTNAKGVVLFESLDPAVYNGKVIPPAPLKPNTFVKEVNTGTNAKIDVLVSVSA